MVSDLLSAGPWTRSSVGQGDGNTHKHSTDHYSRAITTYNKHIPRGSARGLEMEELKENSEIIRATHLTLMKKPGTR